MQRISLAKNEKLLLILILSITCQGAFATQSLTINIPNGSSAPNCDTIQNCYVPKSASITMNGNVTWVNNDSAAHTVTSGDPMSGSDGTFDSGLIPAGNAFSYVFVHTGQYDYYCIVHPWMVGTVQAAVSSGATVELDQKVYTWTDKVYITIVAPDHNVNSSVIDEIGNTNSDPIRVSTRGHDIRNYKLVETGTDTGIFTGEVILTGFAHDADGDGMVDAPTHADSADGTGPTDGFLGTDHNDGITVSFEFAQDETVVGSALIRWNTGEVSWLQTSYLATGEGVVRVIDPDMNLNPEVIDDFQIDVWSDSDNGGIDLTVTETNEATGIFEGTVLFTTTESSSGNKLRVADGDTIAAEYNDHTLAPPHPISSNFEVIQYAKIGGGMAKKVEFPDKRYFVIIEADSEFSDVEFNKNQKHLSFILQEAPKGTKGTLMVHIPRNQLDGEFTVTFDGEEIPFEISSDAQYNHLTIHYTYDPRIDIRATITSNSRTMDNYDVEYWWNPDFNPARPPTLDKDSMILNLAFFRAEMQIPAEFLLSVHGQNRVDSYEQGHKTDNHGKKMINLSEERFGNREIGDPEIYEIGLHLKSVSSRAVDANPISLGEPVTVVPEFPAAAMIMALATSVSIFFIYRLSRSLKKNL